MNGRRTVDDRFAGAMASLQPQLCCGPSGLRLGLAVSGGSDSMALMHLAKRDLAGVAKLAVICLDHAIEGENSASEFAFVEDAAKRLGLEFFGRRADPPVRAGRGLSIEMAAREARRAFFAEAARELRLDAIATAHQRDDVAETLLLRLLRGAGATGLSGLRPLSPAGPRHPAIIRPLLGCGREELRSWLRRHRIRWMDDVANSNEGIPRCRVRLSLIPELAHVMGRPMDEVVASLAQSAAILRDDDDCLDAMAAGAGLAASGKLDLSAVEERHPAVARRAVRRWLMGRVGPAAAGFEQVEALRGANAGDSVNMPGRAVVDVDASRVADLRAGAVPAPPQMPLPIPGSVRWGRFEVSAEVASEAERSRETPNRWPTSCTLSLRAVREAGGLHVRSRRAGETMAPFGLGGTRKLQDIFVDCKIPARLRGSYPVIDAGGRAAWLPGYRIAAPFAVADGEEAVRITVGEVGHA